MFKFYTYFRKIDALHVVQRSCNSVLIVNRYIFNFLIKTDLLSQQNLMFSIIKNKYLINVVNLTFKYKQYNIKKPILRIPTEESKFYVISYTLNYYTKSWNFLIIWLAILALSSSSKIIILNTTTLKTNTFLCRI